MALSAVGERAVGSPFERSVLSLPSSQGDPREASQRREGEGRLRFTCATAVRRIRPRMRG